MERYRHTQRSGQVTAVLLLATAALGWTLAGPALVDPPSRWALALVCGIVVVLFALFSSLTVTVGAGRVDVRFGPGLFGTSVALSEVVAVGVVTNPWWARWGISHVGAGTRFTLPGRDAVELELRNGRRYRIGTDEPDRLAAAIREAAGLGSATMEPARPPRGDR